jgi:hypothetical protein
VEKSMPTNLSILSTISTERIHFTITNYRTRTSNYASFGYWPDLAFGIHKEVSKLTYLLIRY